MRYDKSKVECYSCQKLGHFSRECQNEGSNEERVNLIEDQQDVKEPTLLLALKNEENNIASTWYLDNGASNHMCGDKEAFVKLDEKVKDNVSFGDSSKVQIQGKGTILISLKDDSHSLITDVYYVSMHVRVFRKKQHQEQPSLSNLFTSMYVDPSNHHHSVKVDTSCSLLMITAEKLGVYFLKQKSEAFGAFKNFKALVEKESGFEIKSLRSDRGGEFTSNEFNDFCKANGIRRPLTVPRSPQQNGVAKRKNRTILNMARSMLKVKNMPKEFWVEAVSCAVYFSNRSPTKNVDNVTPQEAWSERKPSVRHILVFGSIAYAHVPDQGRLKIDDRSSKYVFIGYDSNSKGYKLFNPSNGRIVISRDVEFDEQASWNWEAQKEQSYDFFPYFVEEQDVTQSQVVDFPHNMTPHPSPAPIHEETSEESSSSGESSSERPPKFRSVRDLYRSTEAINDFNNPILIEEFKKDMSLVFEMIDVGLICYYLGLEVEESEDGTFISQKGYAKEVLKKFKMFYCNPVDTPMESGVKLSKFSNGIKEDPTLFKSLVGSLRYLTCTRPDILFAVGVITSFVGARRKEDQGLNHLFKGFDNLLELDDKGDVSTRDNGSGLGRFSRLIQISAERLAELLAYV
ncbi:hypothetical protein GQ457_04G014290 [Hibiscus cannabinus]